jgi:hypothetical protein
MDKKIDDDLIRRLKEVFDSVIPAAGSEKYPDEALPMGTYVRPTRRNQLGVITDAFYGELDADDKKIIIYTILLFPQIDSITRVPKRNDQYYLTNEYEYDIVAYLMIDPVDLSKLTANLGEGLFYES